MSVANTFEELLSSLRSHKATASLLDQFTFASQQQVLNEDYLIEKIVANPVTHGFLVSGGSVFVECAQEYLKTHRHQAFTKLQEWIHPLTVCILNYMF